jgi:hypothetical protein
MREYRYLCATKWLSPLGRGAVRREGREINGGRNAREKLRHDVRGGRGEEDAVTVVACGNEMIGLGRQSAKKRKTVGSRGAEACPGFELEGIGERGKQCGGE